MKKGRSKMNQSGGGSGALKVVGLLVLVALWLAAKGMRTQIILDLVK